MVSILVWIRCMAKFAIFLGYLQQSALMKIQISMGKVKIYNPASVHDSCNNFFFQSEYIFTVKITAPRNYLMRLTYYSSALRPSESLSLLNYRHSFFPFNCLLSPSLNLHLPQNLLHTFQPSQSKPSSSSPSFWFTLKILS